MKEWYILYIEDDGIMDTVVDAENEYEALSLFMNNHLVNWEDINVVLIREDNDNE